MHLMDQMDMVLVVSSYCFMAYRHNQSDILYY